MSDKKKEPTLTAQLQLLHASLTKEKRDLLANQSLATTVSTNAFDFAAEECLKIGTQLVKVEKQNQTYKTTIQSLEAQLKKAKEAKNKNKK